MDGDAKTFVLMIVLGFVLICGIVFAAWDHERRTEERQFKLEQLKLVKPVHDSEEILRRLERIERSLEIRQ